MATKKPNRYANVQINIISTNTVNQDSIILKKLYELLKG